VTVRYGTSVALLSRHKLLVAILVLVALLILYWLFNEGGSTFDDGLS
jgi:hypothetical protein